MTGLRLYCALAVIAFKIRPLLLVILKDEKRKCKYVYVSNVLSQHATFPQKTFRKKVGGKKAPELQLFSVLLGYLLVFS